MYTVVMACGGKKGGDRGGARTLEPLDESDRLDHTHRDTQTHADTECMNVLGRCI